MRLQKTQSLQILIFLLVLTFVVLAYFFLQQNLQRLGITSGFAFLKQEAGFELSESWLDFNSTQSYGRALSAGFANTLKVAVLGNVFAIILGILLAFSKLSRNWLLSKLSGLIIGTFRNVPLILQLFFWYALFNEIMPPVRMAYEIIPSVFVSQRGVAIPSLVSHPVYFWMMLLFLVGVLISLFLKFWSVARLKKTGKDFPLWWTIAGLIIGLPLLLFFLNGVPLTLERPVLVGFNFSGGLSLSPEFMSLLLGLVIYTSVFNAEIIRAGIESVKKGQWEAGRSLGLKDGRIMRLIIFPQSMRVVIPPLTSQFLNLTKNSSLAVAIGYPDFVSVANTSLNQNGQALEMVLLIMLVYLVFSLFTSGIMNLMNGRFTDSSMGAR